MRLVENGRQFRESPNPETDSVENDRHSRPRLGHSRAGCGGNPADCSIRGNRSLSHALKHARERVAILDARLLMQHVLGLCHAALAARPESLMTPGESAEFENLLRRREAGEPIAYLIGEREFFSLRFTVTPAVLIPRPETELLVEVALERIPADGGCSVLDLGTGSGVIAVTLAAHRPLAHVLAADASEDALRVAEKNALRLLALTSTLAFPRQGGAKVIQEPLLPAGEAHDFPDAASQLSSSFSLPPRGEERRRPRAGGESGWGGIEFARSDWFSALGDQRFDLIVANPPYIAANDPHLEQGDVRFEPRPALLGGEDGLQCIRHIVAHAHEHLRAGGWLLFEHGYDQADACRELLQATGYIDMVSHRDLAGIPRVAGGRRCT